MATQKKSTPTRKRKPVRKNVGLGIVHIHASFNNTLVTLTDKAGDSLGWASSGKEGFTSSKKSTPFAAAQVMKTIIDKMKTSGIVQAEVAISGVGGGRDSALRVLGASGIDILSINDRTPIAHNGCRQRKPRKA